MAAAEARTRGDVVGVGPRVTANGTVTPDVVAAAPTPPAPVPERLSQRLLDRVRDAVLAHAPCGAGAPRLAGGRHKSNFAALLRPRLHHDLHAIDATPVHAWRCPFLGDAPVIRTVGGARGRRVHSSSRGCTFTATTATARLRSLGGSELRCAPRRAPDAAARAPASSPWCRTGTRRCRHVPAPTRSGRQCRDGATADGTWVRFRRRAAAGRRGGTAGRRGRSSSGPPTGTTGWRRRSRPDCDYHSSPPGAACLDDVSPPRHTAVRGLYATTGCLSAARPTIHRIAPRRPPRRGPGAGLAPIPSPRRPSPSAERGSSTRTCGPDRSSRASGGSWPRSSGGRGGPSPRIVVCRQLGRRALGRRRLRRRRGQIGEQAAALRAVRQVRRRRPAPADGVPPQPGHVHDQGPPAHTVLERQAADARAATSRMPSSISRTSAGRTAATASTGQTAAPWARPSSSALCRRPEREAKSAANN